MQEVFDFAQPPTTAELYAYLDALDREIAEARRLAAPPGIGRQALVELAADECGCDPTEIWRDVFGRK